MENPIALIVFAFFLYWLSEGLALIFEKAFLEIENKFLWRKILKKLEKELNFNA